MGNQTSKVVRRFPQTPGTMRHTELPKQTEVASSQINANKTVAEEQRITTENQQTADLMSRLDLRVERSTNSSQSKSEKSSDFLRIVRNRTVGEPSKEEKISKLTSSNVYRMLEQYNTEPDVWTAERLSKAYHLEPETIKTLAKHFKHVTPAIFKNPPTPAPKARRPTM
ncbi:hypothetical protein K7432_013568 [Basidiobolus ranarum]|uniref:Uncharacterized protein n=1 Tax=Basidiobolus ranarum TaxID=34480 RepID=A0ABR2WJ10_9FUNG